MQPIFLSPHLDDVTLSCGGHLIQLADAGLMPTVVNIMAGDPPSGRLSDFARKTHRDWGDPEDMLATRHAEDVEAMALLGAQTVYLNWPDAIYRRGTAGEDDWLYTSNDTLFAPLHPSELPLMGRLADELPQHLGPASDAQVYAPLGAGSHVDHLLVRGAALRLWEVGYRVLFYEEMPYAMRSCRLALALSQLPSQPVGQVILLSQAEFARKLAAVQCYRSQLVGVFGTVKATAPSLTERAERVGAGAGLAERTWWLGG